MTGPILPDTAVDTRWMAEGLCVGMDPDLWFADKGDHRQVAHAIEVCQQCPVQERCLEYALTTNQNFGTWGGVPVKERRRMRRARGLTRRTFFQPEGNTA